VRLVLRFQDGMLIAEGYGWASSAAIDALKRPGPSPNIEMSDLSYARTDGYEAYDVKIKLRRLLPAEGS
jgi:hypothetical protein